MRKIYLLILPTLMLSVLPLTAQETFKIKNSPYSYELTAADGKCVLTYSKKGVAEKMTLDVPSDCKVVRRGANGTVITHYYKDIKATVLMVGGGLSKGNCKGESAAATQTILISSSGAKLGKQREGTCLPDGPDEKEFWLSSH